MTHFNNTSAMKIERATDKRCAKKLNTWIGALAAVSSAVLVVGCGRLEPLPPSHVFTDPNVRFPIHVTDERVLFDLPIGRSKDGIIGAPRRDLVAFLGDFRRSGHREIDVTVPGSHAGNPIVSSTVDELMDIIAQAGISAHSVRVRTGGGASYGRPWITLGYSKEVAQGPACGVWEHNLADDRSNIPYDNFGCAQRANLAAMIAYPSDLENVRAMSPRIGERRGPVWEKYVKGELGKDDKNEKQASFGAGK